MGDLAPIVAVCQAGLSFCVLWVWWISRACKQLFDVTFFVNCSAVFIYFRILERNGLIAYGAQHDLLQGPPAESFIK